MSNPVFHYLFAQYKLPRERGLEGTDEARRLFSEMLTYALPEYLEVAYDAVVEMGLIPKQADGCSDDGEPLFDLESLCERLNINPDDVPDHLLKNA
jgi:hypothetical protein